MSPQTTKIYNEAKACLERHVTLNNNVPSEVGCAEAVSYILQKAGVQGIPVNGIAGTATLYEWLTNNKAFTRVYAPTQGAIIVSPTGYGNGTIPGHTGIIGIKGLMYPNDFGIVSNDSQTGLVLELWDLTRWNKYYHSFGNLPVAYFVAN